MRTQGRRGKTNRMLYQEITNLKILLHKIEDGEITRWHLERDIKEVTRMLQIIKDINR